MRSCQLSGKRIVVVEDDPLIKSSIEAALSDAGAIIVSASDRKIDAAVLDVRIGKGISSAPIAMTLELRKVPFFFYTGYSDSVADALRARWPHCKVLSKPLSSEELVSEVAGIFAPQPTRQTGRFRSASFPKLEMSPPRSGRRRDDRASSLARHNTDDRQVGE